MRDESMALRFIYLPYKLYYPDWVY